MTRLLLIRHGDTDAVGRRAVGRLPGIHLNAAGRRQAESLAERLAGVPIERVYCSPLERARETAAPLAARLRRKAEVRQALDELDYGEWTGRTFEELEGEPLWREYNTFRSGTRIPGGEHIAEVQARVTAELEALRDRHPGAVVAVVSHGDVIKAALTWYAGIPPDLMNRLEILPASVSILELGGTGPRLLRVNDTGPLDEL